MIRIPGELLNRLSPKTRLLSLGNYCRGVENYFAVPLEWLQAFFRVLWACGFIFLICLFDFWVFTRTTAAQDIFLGIYTDNQLSGNAPGFIYSGHLPFFWSTLLFSFLLWYSSRMLLHTIHLSRSGYPAWDRKVTCLKKWFPRLFAMVPFAVNAVGFSAMDFPRAVFGNLAFSLGVFLLVLFRLPLLKMLRSLTPGIDQPHDPMRKDSRRIGIDAAGISICRLPVLPFFLLGLQFLLAIIFSLDVSTSAWTAFGAPAIFLLALSGCLIVAVFITYLNHRSAYLFSIIALGVFALFSLNNGRHQVSFITNSDADMHRREINYDFYNWLQKRVRTRQLNKESTKILPVFIVAAEGGGSKALNWTTLVMEQIRSLENNHFSDYIYALTGTSGGAGGLIIDQALNYGLKTDPVSGSASNKPSGGALLDDDLLAPLTGTLCYPDMVQRLLPLSFDRLDRTRRLEASWEEIYRKRFGGEVYSLNNSFLSLWQSQEGRDIAPTPNLLLNACQLETGEKMIISNLKLPSSYFPETLDFYHEVQQDLPLKTIAALTARYPFLVSSGRICAGKSAHKTADCISMSDGGSRDNTSLQTAIQLLLLMKESSLTFQSETGTRVKLGLIYIRNSDHSPRTNAAPGLRLLKDRMLNKKDGKRASEIPVDLIQRLSKPELLNFDFFQFTLNPEATLSSTTDNPSWDTGQPESIPIPDGWYLSRTARAEILEQARFIPYSPQEIIRQFPNKTSHYKTAIQNALNFERLRGALTN